MARRALTGEERAQGRRLAGTLRRARERQPWAQAELARRSGVSVDAIRALERNRVSAPSFITVARLARELRLSLDELADDAFGDANLPGGDRELGSARGDDS